MLKSEKDYMLFLLDSGLEPTAMIKALRGYIETRKFDSLSAEYRKHKKESKDELTKNHD